MEDKSGVGDGSFDLTKIYMMYLARYNLHYDEKQYNAVSTINYHLAKILKKNRIFDKIKKNFFSHNFKNIFYIYGSVGSGKSVITNLIYRNFPVSYKKKVRATFYNLIDSLRNKIHSTIASHPEKKLSNHQILSNILRNELKNTALLCIDEFHILDIADAMIIGDFIKILTKSPNTTVIINSNRHPSELYNKGIHKERFEPTIKLLLEKSHLIHLSTNDYRSHFRDFPKNYFIFGESQVKNEEDFKKIFYESSSERNREREIIILSQKIKFMIKDAQKYQIGYFNFNELFNKSLYATNYESLIKQFNFKKIFINDIPGFDGRDDLAKRFIAFIDVAYESNVTLVLSSNLHFDKLYTSGLVIFEFGRTVSRIRTLCN